MYQFNLKVPIVKVIVFLGRSEKNNEWCSSKVMRLNADALLKEMTITLCYSMIYINRVEVVM